MAPRPEIDSTSAAVKWENPLRAPFSLGSCQRHRSCSYHERLVLRLLEYVDFTDNGCWIWRGAVSGAHGQLGYCHAGHRRPLRVQNLSYWIWRGPVPAGAYVSRCVLDSLCVNPDHVDLATAGKGKDGSISAKRVRAVEEIVGNTPTPITLNEIGRLFGVSREAVREVVAGAIQGGARGKLTPRDCELIRGLYGLKREMRDQLAAKEADAARALGISRTAVARYRRRASAA